jgi:hypothetical protein
MTTDRSITAGRDVIASSTGDGSSITIHGGIRTADGAAPAKLPPNHEITAGEQSQLAKELHQVAGELLTAQGEQAQMQRAIISQIQGLALAQGIVGTRVSKLQTDVERLIGAQLEQMNFDTTPQKALKGLVKITPGALLGAMLGPFFA